MTLFGFRRLLLPGILTFLASEVSFAVTSPDEVQSAATEWAELKSAAASAEQEWSFGKPFLEETLDARNARVRDLESKIEAADAAARLNASNQAEVRERMEAADAYLEVVKDSLGKTVETLLSMRNRMPPRLSDSLDLSYMTMSDEERPISERWQAAVMIMNRCMQFDHSIVKAEEVIQSDGGEPRLVETIYWGLALGYALDREAGVAWRAVPDENGWEWKLFDDSGSVADAIDIYSERADPQFVFMGAQLSDQEQNNEQ